MDVTVNYYSLLGIDRRATADEVKRAYRKMVFQYHPDRNPNDDGAADKLKQILEGYSVLSDDHKRALYDEATKDAFEEGRSPQEGAVDEEPVKENSAAGFNTSQQFQQRAEGQPRCPGCSAVGIDQIVSRKGGAGTSKGKQFVLSPFNIIYCSECGHVYGVTGQSG